MTGMPPKVTISSLSLVKPTLVDFLRVTHGMPAEQRKVYEAMRGVDFDADQVAIEFANTGSPCWAAITAEGNAIGVGGFIYLRPGVWQDWLATTAEAWSPAYWRSMSKLCRRVMDHMMVDSHRLQCITLADQHDAHRWYRLVGYEFENSLRKYGAKGEDAVMYSRVAS